MHTSLLECKQTFTNIFTFCNFETFLSEKCQIEFELKQTLTSFSFLVILHEIRILTFLPKNREIEVDT